MARSAAPRALSRLTPPPRATPPPAPPAPIDLGPRPGPGPHPSPKSPPKSPAGGPFQAFPAGKSWVPSVNLYEADAGYVVCVDLAGTTRDKLDVELNGQQLTIRGRRDVPLDFPGGGRCRVHVMEIDYGSFTRAVELPPDTDRDAISAAYRDGLLWIQIPRKGSAPQAADSPGERQPR